MVDEKVIWNIWSTCFDAILKILLDQYSVNDPVLVSVAAKFADSKVEEFKKRFEN